jgi:hypothetical protein
LSKTGFANSVLDSISDLTTGVRSGSERETAFGCRIWRIMTTMAVVADSDGYFGQHLFGVGAALLTRRSHNNNPLINLRFKFVRGVFWTAVM